MRVGVEEALGQHLPVERLEQLARRLARSSAVGASRSGTPTTSSMTSSRPRRELRVHAAARRAAGTARAPRASARCSPPPRGSRARGGATTRDARRRPGCRRARESVSRPSAFSAKSASSPRSRSISVRRVRPLHLDDDPVAALEPCPVHLPDRARRPAAPARCSRTRPPTARRAPPPSPARPRPRSAAAHVVLEARELLDELGRDQVGPGREHLAELARTSGRAPRAPPAAGRAVGLVLAVSRLAGRASRRQPRSAQRARSAARRPARSRAAPRLRPLPSGCSAVFTITTVQAALCETRFGTLPSRNSLRPLMPMLPTTRTSAVLRLGGGDDRARRIVAGGDPGPRAGAGDLLRVDGELGLGPVGRRTRDERLDDVSCAS